MNPERLSEMGFTLGRPLGGFTQGAWSATTADGSPVVLKWSPGGAMVERYSSLLPGLDRLRRRGVPVPEYLDVIPFDGGTLSVQQLLPGEPQDNPSSAVIDQMVGFVAAKSGIKGPPTDKQPDWGRFVVHTLTVGWPGWGEHQPLTDWGPRSRGVLTRIQAVGAVSEPGRFADDGLVHLDLHTDNVLIDDGKVTGIIDWEGACAGDHLYDLLQYVFDLDGHDQPVWDIVDTAGFDPQVLRAYLALLALKCTSSAIRWRPGDVPRQLDRAERVFGRYGI